MARLLLFAALAAAGARAETHRAQVTPAAHHDVSPPLWLMRPAEAVEHEDHEPRPFRKRQLLAPVTDPVVQSSFGIFAPPTATDFEAMGAGFTGPAGTFAVQASPPDTDGAVGPNDYVSLVNSGFAVIRKSDGTARFGPVSTNTLWSGFGTSCGSNDSTAQCACQLDNDGDGIVLYDRAAGRWFITQFAVTFFMSSTATHRSTFQCVAVSQSGDPTGQWNRYVFSYADRFNDYGKFGAWPDGYYATYNMFDLSSNYAGAKICAFDRASMLAGAAATQQCFDPGLNFGGLLPSDLDGATAPPAGSPNYIVGFNEGAAACGSTSSCLQLWKAHIDWANQANSTLTGPTNIQVAPFTQPCGDTGGTCVVEPIPNGSTSETLDSLGDRMMFRLAYRNFGDHESLVTNHTVTAGSSSGVRWYELQSPNGTPVVAQQSTYAPDSMWRWMGSIAMDKVGNIAMGYSISDATHAPSINYAGHLVSDSAGDMGQGEAQMFLGKGSEVGTDSRGNIITRWGDYSSMTIDPTDDCTFWYVGEYLATNGQFNWHTRVGHFKFANCGAADFGIGVTPPAAGTQIAAGSTADYTVTTSALNGFTGAITFGTSGLPAGVTATFNPTSVTAGASSVMTLHVAGGTADTASTTFTVTGTSGSLNHGATSIVSVGSGAVANDFTLTVTPPVDTTLAPGASIDYTVDTTLIGSAENVALSVSGLPPGVTGTFSANPIASGTTGTLLTLAAAPDAANSAATVFTVTGTAASGSKSGTASVTVAGPNFFQLALDRASGAIAPGGTTTFTVSSSIFSGDNSEVIALSVDTLPNGVTGSFSPATIHAGDTSTLTLAANASASGVSTFNVNGSSLSDFQSVSADLSVVADDFSLAITPSSATVAPGAGKTFTISATTVSGSPAAIALGVLGSLPAGVTASAISPATINPGGTATVTLNVASGAALVANAPFQIQGIDSVGVAQTATGHLTIGTTSDFGISLNPGAATVSPGRTTTVAVSTSVASGSAETIALGLTGLPGGVTGSFSPAAVTAGNGSTLTLTAASSAALVSNGSYTVTGTATSATHTALGTVTVVNAPTAAVASPADGATVSGTVNIEATGAAGNGLTLAKLEIRVDDTVVTSATASPAQGFWQSTEFPDGTHTITARAVDSIGTSTTSAPVTVTVHNATTTTTGGGGSGGGCASGGASGLTLLGLLGVWRRRRRA